MQHTAQQYLTELMEAGTFALPGGEKLQSELNADILEPYPPLPTMHQLVTTGQDGDKKLQIPSPIVKLWSLHPQFGKRFTEWLNTFVEKHGVFDESESEGTSKKKEQHLPASLLRMGGPPTKRQNALAMLLSPTRSPRCCWQR